MRMNRLQYILTLLLLIGQWAYAQDTLPIQPKPDRHSAPIYSSEEMTRLMEFIAVDNPMPEQFLQTTDNVLIDPTASLASFWTKLKRLDRPVRIVHIGDSHVRGHVFPYVMRRCLEDDFGAKAVEDLPVSYQTSGLAVETGRAGVVYHILGVNGATCASYSTPERLEKVASLHPDLDCFFRHQRGTRAALFGFGAYRSPENDAVCIETRVSRCGFLADYASGCIRKERKTRSAGHQSEDTFGGKQRTEVCP